MRLKIKSVTDVITNSSTEVFTVKAADLEEAKSIPEIYNKMEVVDRWSGAKSNTLDNFHVFNTIEDVERVFKHHQNLEIFSDVFGGLLRPFKLREDQVKLLLEFGHTEEEIEKYEAKKDAERIKLRDSNKKIQNLIGQATVEAYDHAWIGHDTAFEKWLKKNKKEFKHDIG